MKILKRTNSEKFCECCKKEVAGFDICFGDKVICLCKECAWDLEWALDDTTSTNFQGVEVRIENGERNKFSIQNDEPDNN